MSRYNRDQAWVFGGNRWAVVLRAVSLIITGVALLAGASCGEDSTYTAPPFEGPRLTSAPTVTPSSVPVGGTMSVKVSTNGGTDVWVRSGCFNPKFLSPADAYSWEGSVTIPSTCIRGTYDLNVTAAAAYITEPNHRCTDYEYDSSYRRSTVGDTTTYYYTVYESYYTLGLACNPADRLVASGPTPFQVAVFTVY